MGRGRARCDPGAKGCRVPEQVERRVPDLGQEVVVSEVVGQRVLDLDRLSSTIEDLSRSARLSGSAAVSGFHPISLWFIATA